MGTENVFKGDSGPRSGFGGDGVAYIRPGTPVSARDVSPDVELPRPNKHPIITDTSCEFLIRRTYESSDDERLSDHQALFDAATSIVEVKIFWIDSSTSCTESVLVTSGEGGQLVVQRVTATAPTGESSWTSPRDALPTGEYGKGHSVAEKFKDALADYVISKEIDPAWKQCVEGWKTPHYEDLASAAEGFSKLRDQLHQLLVGEPIQSLTGFEPLGDIMAEMPLPGDRLLATAKIGLDAVGALAGGIAGPPLVTNACAKALVEDLAMRKARDFLTKDPG